MGKSPMRHDILLMKITIFVLRNRGKFLISKEILRGLYGVLAMGRTPEIQPIVMPLKEFHVFVERKAVFLLVTVCQKYLLGLF